MTIHIFNPEHEHALAADLEGFTPPRAARQLRSDLSFLPALWAEDGDIVMVEDAVAAEKAWRGLDLRHRSAVEFATPDMIKRLLACGKDVTVSPWGWDKTIRKTLLKAGVPAETMPSTDALDTIRSLSNRSLAVELLAALGAEHGVTGLSCVCNTYDDVLRFLAKHRETVVKAPWSCSGRGVRYIGNGTLTDNDSHWIQRVISQQQSVVAEVRCRKVADFAIEFMAEEDATVSATGLSLFTTSGGTYTGNVLASEEEKRTMIGRYLPLTLLDGVTEKIENFLSDRIGGAYTGPLGVDMMITEGDNGAEGTGFLLNPCVEINLRRTMGHVALALSSRGHMGTMGITFENKSYNITITDDNL